MTPLIINGKKVSCPSCYEELTTGMYQRIIKEWDHEEPDLAKRDYFKLFSILTDTNYKGIAQTPEMDETIWNAIGWYVTQPFKFSTELPKVMEINGKKIKVPRKVGALGSGQNVLLRQAIERSRYMEENISIAVAVCLQPIYDEGKFDVDRARELEETILEMPIYLTHPVGFFLLQTVRPHGLEHTNGSPRRRGSLAQILKGMSRLWRKSTALKSLTIYPS